jgi:hypothetical protein
MYGCPASRRLRSRRLLPNDLTEELSNGAFRGDWDFQSLRRFLRGFAFANEGFPLALLRRHCASDCSTGSMLDEPLSKIARAKEHCKSLETYVVETFAVDTNRPGIAVKFNPQTKEHILYICRMPDLQPFFRQVGLILGDAVQNLRSSLDYLVYQLASWNTHGKVRFPGIVQFPIDDFPSQFRKSCQRRLIEVHPYHRTRIEWLQPYHGTYPNEFLCWLRVLRELSNKDKHQSLTPVIFPAEDIDGHLAWSLIAYFERIGMVGAVKSVSTPTIGPMILGTEIATLTGPIRFPVYDVEMARYKFPQVTFPDARPIVSVLESITKFVTYLVTGFYPVPEFLRPSPILIVHRPGKFRNRSK